VSFDEELFDEANQERLRQIDGVKTVDSVDDVDEALARNDRRPALYTLYDGNRSEGRYVARSKQQRIEPRCSVIVVASSLRSKKDGRIGALKLMRLVKNKMVGFTNSQCSMEFIYEKDDMVRREKNLVAYEVMFRAAADDDFT
jgi:hypothetical protein